MGERGGLVEGRAGVGVSRGVGVPPAAKLEVTFGGEVGVGRVVGEKDREGVFTGVTVELPRDREGEGEVVTETAGEGEMEGDGVEERVERGGVPVAAGREREEMGVVVGEREGEEEVVIPPNPNPNPPPLVGVGYSGEAVRLREEVGRRERELVVEWEAPAAWEGDSVAVEVGKPRGVGVSTKMGEKEGLRGV